MSSDITVAGDPLAAPARLAVPVAPAVPASVARLTALARTHAEAVARDLAQVRFDALSRWYRLLARGEDHEVWLISWLPGQGTGRHDHGDAAGVLTVVHGELRERSLVVEPAHRAGEHERVLRPGQVRVFGRTHVHEVTNVTAGPAVSVHVYAPRLTTMTPYDDAAVLAPPAPHRAAAPRADLANG